MYPTTYTAWDTVFWPWLTVGSVVRPSRMTPKSQKDELYDDNCGRYYLSTVLQPYRNFYLSEYANNRNLVLNGPSSWGTSEAVREFLGDTNNPTGRLAWRYTIMQPMHTRLVGSGSSISAAAKAQATTSNVYVRKEAALYESLLRSVAAAQGPEMAEAMAQFGVTPDQEKTEEMHENLWTDPYAKAMTNLLTAIGKRQKIEQKLAKLASNIALSGVGAMHVFPNGNYLEAEVCEPGDIGWDTSAIRPDFSDGEFCYIARLMSVQDIAEQFQPAREKIIALDRWANMQAAQHNSANIGWPQRRPRVFTVYFKDLDYVERGFIDMDGEPYYVTVNEPNPDDPNGKPQYTDKDLIDPPDNEFTRSWTKAELKAKKQMRGVATLRYISMIPWEYLPGAFNKDTDGTTASYTDRAKKVAEMRGGRDVLTHLSPTGDLILESGEYPLQEEDPDQNYGVSFPIKFASWMHLSGMVIAPLSCVRDIQGMMNATLSDMLMRMSRAEIPTTVFDHDALAAAGISAAQASRNMKDGKSFGIKGALVGGIQNAVGNVGTALDARFYQMFSILDQLYMMAQNATGIYDQNFGAPGGQDVLVRVKELQSRQSGVMLKPFFDAIQSVLEQVYQFDAQAGKRFFSARPWALEQMVGEEGLRMLVASKDFTDEQFRVEVVLTQDAEQRREAANQMVLQDLQMGLLDQVEAAQLRGRSLPEDVYDAERRFTKRMAEAAKMQAEQQQAAMEQQAVAQQQMAIDQEKQQIQADASSIALEQEKMQRKSAQPFMQAMSEHIKPNDQAELEELLRQQA